MKYDSEVVIVGAGASGLLCGGILAEAGIPVMILEKNKKPGKKLAATGNGRCNFTNLYMDTERYYGDAGWLGKILDRYPPDRIIRFFRRIGVYDRERQGYVYPHTNQASTVVDALQGYCERGMVEIVTDCRVSAVLPMENRKGYRVTASRGDICCRTLILATGGQASQELGGDTGGYELARSLGHTIHKTCPGLTGLRCGGDWWKRVAGTRIQGRFSLRIDGKFRKGECGEIQISRDGVSGIPVFQLCREAAEAVTQGRDVEGVIDFVPPMEPGELRQWLSDFGLQGLVPKKWVPVLQDRSGLCRVLKEFSFTVRDTFGMERAQVTAGGADTAQVCAETMESGLAPDVFLVGELLDIDGKCGGYNLHFAWSCAMTAADAILCRREKGENDDAADISM